MMGGFGLLHKRSIDSQDVSYAYEPQQYLKGRKDA